MRKDMLKSIKAGLEVGEDWYNSEELLDWFTTGYGPDEGLRQYHEFLDLIGAASPGSKVPPNIGNATAIREKLYTDPTYADKARAVFTDAEGRALAKERAQDTATKLPVIRK